MCDCYAHKCKFCENKLSIHIADYCTARKNVCVICPDCLRNLAIPYFSGRLNIKKFAQLYIDQISNREQLFGKLAGNKYKGKIVLLFSKDPKAYGVCLN